MKSIGAIRLFLLSLLVAFSCLTQSSYSITEGDYEIRADTNSSDFDIFVCGGRMYGTEDTWFSFLTPGHVFADTLHSQSNLIIFQESYSPEIDSTTNSIVASWYICYFWDWIKIQRIFSFTPDSMIKVTFDMLRSVSIWDPSDDDPYDPDSTYYTGLTTRIFLKLDRMYGLRADTDTLLHDEIPDTLIFSPHNFFDFVTEDAFKPDTIFIGSGYIEMVYTPRRIGHGYHEDYYSAVFKFGSRDEIILKGELPVYRGWNLLSIPDCMNDPFGSEHDIEHEFPFSEGIGFFLDSNSDWQYDSVADYSDGFWLYSPIDTMWSYSYNWACTGNGRYKLIYPGWNLIGSLASPCYLRRGWLGSLTGPVYSYDPVSHTCFEVDTLIPGRGYWIYNDLDGSDIMVLDPY